jgi:Domain of unknown function (DUF4402)
MNAQTVFKVISMQHEQSSKLPQRGAARSFSLLLAIGVLTSATLAFATPAPLTIAKDNDLNFGSFVVINNGVVTVDPSDTVQYSNAVAVSGASPRAARFTVSGEPNSTVTISLPPVPLRQDGAGVSASFSDFEATANGVRPPPMDTSFDVQLPATGTLELSVGAKATISRSTGSGSLSVNVPVTVTYRQ